MVYNDIWVKLTYEYTISGYLEKTKCSTLGCSNITELQGINTFDNNIPVLLTKYMDIFIQHSQIFIRFLFSITFKSKKSNIKISKIDWNKKEAPEYV